VRAEERRLRKGDRRCVPRRNGSGVRRGNEGAAGVPGAACVRLLSEGGLLLRLRLVGSHRLELHHLAQLTRGRLLLADLLRNARAAELGQMAVAVGLLLAAALHRCDYGHYLLQLIFFSGGLLTPYSLIEWYRTCSAMHSASCMLSSPSRYWHSNRSRS